MCVPGAIGAPSGARGAARADVDAPLRILVVGDSITQGSAGDWTWRYRLWQHLTAAGVAVDFVGPRSDLWDNVAGHDGDTSYVNPAFDRDHAARWGMTLGAQDHPIDELVEEFEPDVVLELLGVNDLTFGGQPPGDVRDLLHDFVDDARSADPDLTFVLGRIPRSDLPQVDAFNDLVTDLAGELGTPTSPVGVASTDEDYDEDQDTWDGGHPNSHGEVKIAAAFADGLHAVGIGPVATRPLPDVPRGPRIPPVLTARGTVRGADLDWVRSPGSDASEVWARDVTEGGTWQRVAGYLTGTSYHLSGLPPWHRVQLRTEPYKGNWLAQADAWSNVVEVEASGTALDAPTGVAAQGDPTGTVAVTWAPVPGAASYAVQWRRLDEPGGWLGTVTTAGRSASIAGLAGRSGYAVRVRAERGGLVGDFSFEAWTAVPAVGPVTHVRLRPTGHGVRTKGDAVAFASSYTLRVATTRRCGRVPGDARFAVRATGLATPVRRLRTDARAVWVRWVAVGNGLEGDLAPSSTACLPLPR